MEPKYKRLIEAPPFPANIRQGWKWQTAFAYQIAVLITRPTH